MTAFEDCADELLRTLRALAQVRGGDSARVLREAQASLLETGYDNWNGGTELYTFELAVPAKTFAEIEAVQDEVEKAFLSQLQKILRTEPGVHLSEVVIRPVVPPDEPIAEDADEGIWTQGNFRLFLSHHSSIKAGVEKLRDALRPFCISGFVAHADIEPTKQWESQIEAALRTMDALAAVINEHFKTSAWCDQEVGYAMGRGRLVIPLRAGADPHGFLGKFQGLQAKGTSSDVLAQRMFNILARNDATKRRLTEVVINRLLAVGSWEEARDKVKLLEGIANPDGDLLDHLSANWKTNDKIVESYTVPERIQRILVAGGRAV